MTGHLKFEVRAANADDARAVAESRAEVAAEGRWILAEPPVDIDAAMDVFRRVLDDDTAHVVVAVDADDRFIGMASGFDQHPGPVTFGMHVLAEHRRQGVGSALLQSILSWSRERGSHKVVLEVWPHNHAAIGLYERHGFVREGLRPRQYRRRDGEVWDIVEMGLVLV
ncbi:GNAT family N-acetyltransferase [Gordonia sp. LSe1-13]|uniref:GNAT family N-acetyltransferase n=1 Tax=Gordonia sesuvii TaxID=3116777 RepID=A0ABU7M803_9ACTN|nr:GNAT family N-acetyltransferase [Gordonia sp. LSe1-13]